MMGYYYGWPMMGGYYGGLAWVFMIFWWAVIIAVVILLVKWIIPGQKGHRSERDALDILKARYAKGEIDKKEFEEKSRDIKNL